MRLSRCVAGIAVATAGIGVWLAVEPGSGAILAQAQQPAAPAQEKGTGIIVGQIVDARGSAVPDAIVTLQGGLQPIALTTTNRAIPGGPRSTRTTNEGHFAFFDLTPGTYALDVSKPGFIAGAYGRVRPGGLAQSVTLGDGELLTSVRLTIWEYAGVSGTIRDEAGEPMVGVSVRAFRRGLVHGRFQFVTGLTATTDDRGQYRIDLLTPGRYVIAVANTQTAVPLAAVRPPAGTATPPDPDAQLLARGISRAGSSAGGREVAGQLWVGVRGSLMAVPDPDETGRVLAYPTTFHPGARSIREAELISLESGEQRPNVDIQLRLAPTVLVSGVITGDVPMAGINLRLVPDYAEDLGGDVRMMETAIAVCDASGQFVFVGVPPGQYYLQTQVVPESAIPGGSPAVDRRGWLNERVTVGDEGLRGFSLPLRPVVAVSGRIAFDGSKTPPPPDLIQRLTVSLETIGFAINRVEAPYQATFNKDGQFLLHGVPPGRYVMTFRAAIADRQAMPDWEFKSITLNGQDISDRPTTITESVSGVVVTLTNNNTELNGLVRDATGKPDPHAAVLLFTTERDLWQVRMVRRIRSIRAGETGAYVVRGVPPGDYFVVAIPDAEIGDFPDPAMLDALSKIATRISVAPARHVTQNLILRSIRRP
jgi:hypothetical protein